MEIHVDGFRFDLASILTRGSRLSSYTSVRDFLFVNSIANTDIHFLFPLLGYFSLWDAVNVYGNQMEDDMLTTGSPLSNPPLIDMISNDPILRGVKVYSIVRKKL